MTTTADILSQLGACPEAREWVGDRTPEQAWLECPRGDWMLWAAAKLDVDRRRIVQAACACARLVLHLVPDGEERPRVAIEAAEAWTRGEATLEEVREAAYAAAYAAAYVAYAAHAAAYAAAYAAYAAAYAARVAAEAAAEAAALDGDAAAVAHAAEAMHQRCADAVREAIPWEAVAAAIARMLQEEGRAS